MGQLEPPLALADRAGEGPLLMAEKLALEQRLGQRGTVDRDEWKLPARRGIVHGARDQLFAGARFAEDQHGADRLGDVADQLEDVAHPRALAEDAVERRLFVQLPAKRGDFVFERPLAQRPLHHELQVFEIDRLRQEIGRARSHRLHRVIHRAESRW